MRAAQDFNIDLETSWMISDKDKDVIAGKAAGCATILIAEHFYDEADYTTYSLSEAVNYILRKVKV